MNQKLISLLLVPVLLISMCLSVMGAETAEVTETADSVVYGEPWLTSIVDGMVTEDLEKPDLKDDFFLNSNYEWLRDTEMLAGHMATGGGADVQDLLAERIAGLFTDESITGGGDGTGVLCDVSGLGEPRRREGMLSGTSQADSGYLQFVSASPI